jgi:hypothetical protein
MIVPDTTRNKQSTCMVNVHMDFKFPSTPLIGH